LISTYKHRKRGNVEIKLSIILGACMILGVEIGKRVLLALTAHGLSEMVLRLLYVVLLMSLGIAMLIEVLRAGSASKAAAPAAERKALGQRLCLAPMLRLRDGQTRLSFWLLLACGLFIGTLAGVLGVGGGFLLMPLMVYGMGLPTVVAVGSSLLSLMFTSFYATISYSSSGMVEFVAAGIMIVGAGIGAPIGVRASGAVDGQRLRLLYAILTLLGGTAVLLDLLQYSTAARWLLLGNAIGMMILILAWSTLAKLFGSRNDHPAVCVDN